VLADLKRLRCGVEALYILGDLIGPHPQCEALVQRVQQPRQHELTPQVCIGWWEEQCFNLHGMGSDPEATELLEQVGADGVERLWKSVSRQTVQWLRSLDFGFFELDCLLIHGSTVGCHDVLTPETPPMQLLDRLLRADANTLFCGRSGQTFHLQIPAGAVTSTVTTLDAPTQIRTQTVRDRQVVGVGSVGRAPGKVTYTLYNPYSNAVSFQLLRGGAVAGGC